jgi:hypothetical protein
MRGMSAWGVDQRITKRGRPAAMDLCRRRFRFPRCIATNASSHAARRINPEVLGAQEFLGHGIAGQLTPIPHFAILLQRFRVVARQAGDQFLPNLTPRRNVFQESVLAPIAQLVEQVTLNH